ncbi:MAG: hypothetical protein NVS4B11_18020 [Ktedonobacteraceae bacterium]
MSDAHNKTPNWLLRHAREGRGWSQSYVAKRVDTNAFTVSRWEKGITFPNPEHRLRLCELFEKSAAELGLIPPSSENQHSTTTSDVFPTALYDPAIPHLFHALVGREDMLVALKHLLDKQPTMTLAIKGLPGVGKTAVAVALAHDEEVRALFSSTILWARLGYQPNISGLLSRWGKLLGLTAAHMQTLSNGEELTKAIRTTIGTKRMLIVIDDAWKVDETFALQVGGPNCVYLITTRQAEVALQCADTTTTLHELSEDEGVALLTQIAPTSKSATNDIRTLVRSVGGLPLAITLMGRYIQAETFSKHKRRLSHALERLRSVEERLRLTQPLDPTEGITSIPNGTPFSLQSVIAVSDQHLSQEARAALRVLAVFPPKPNTFQEEAALALAAVIASVLDELTDASLLESQGQGYYTLHPVIADYAKIVGSEEVG